MDSALCPASAGISPGLLMAAILRYRPKRTHCTTDGPPASQAERIAAVRQRHRHGLDVKALPARGPASLIAERPAGRP